MLVVLPSQLTTVEYSFFSLAGDGAQLGKAGLTPTV